MKYWHEIKEFIDEHNVEVSNIHCYITPSKSIKIDETICEVGKTYTFTALSIIQTFVDNEARFNKIQNTPYGPVSSRTISNKDFGKIANLFVEFAIDKRTEKIYPIMKETFTGDENIFREVFIEALLQEKEIPSFKEVLSHTEKSPGIEKIFKVYMRKIEEQIWCDMIEHLSKDDIIKILSFWDSTEPFMKGEFLDKLRLHPDIAPNYIKSQLVSTWPQDNKPN